MGDFLEEGLAGAVLQRSFLRRRNKYRARRPATNTSSHDFKLVNCSVTRAHTETISLLTAALGEGSPYAFSAKNVRMIVRGLAGVQGIIMITVFQCNNQYTPAL